MVDNVRKPNLTPLEKEEAATAMAYMQMRGLRFTHIRNETADVRGDGKVRNWRAVLDYKAGVSKGFPDFVIALPGIGLLIVELKREKGNEASPEQLEWIEILNTVPGVEARVCKGAGELISFIEELLPLR